MPRRPKRVMFMPGDVFQREISEDMIIPWDELDFAHWSDREVARLLDFYGITFLYEVFHFALELDDNGLIKKLFAPDFYLPDYDIFIELTTLRQSLTTRKNKKVRQLKEIYPDVNVKIFYRKDIERLSVKFGLKEKIKS